MGIGVGSTHSSSSRSVESDEIVREEKSTAVGLLLLLLCGMVGPPALGVTGPTGSSSVPPPLPLWPLSEAARKERRSPAMTAPSPASKKSSDESSSSSSRVEPSPSGYHDVSYYYVTFAFTSSSSPSPTTPSALSLYRPACRPRLPRDPTLIRGCRQRPTTTAARRRSRKSFYGS